MALWAKLADEGGSHPLVCHLLDTGTVAGALWDGVLSPGVRTAMTQAFGLGLPPLRAWLCYWASLHDIGKATAGFQDLAARRHPTVIDRLKRCKLKFPPTSRRHRHDVLTAAVLRGLSGDGANVLGLDQRFSCDLAVALGGHHGVFPISRAIQAVGPRELGRARWMESRRALIQCLREHWGVTDAPRPVVPDQQHQAAWMVLAGFVCVADWLASCTDYFPYASPEPDLPSYVAGLPGKARAALERSGWLGSAPRFTDRPFTDVFSIDAANRLQDAAFEAAGALDGPGLVLIEGPTGMGKTEAALEILRDVSRRFGHAGAYVALPTQVTSNQAFDRFTEFLTAALEPGTVNVQLLHSQAQLVPSFEALRPSNVLQDEPSEQAVTVAHEWFLASKRKLLAPFGVGTVDQGLLGVLQTRHFFLRLFGLAGKVVILDEVHAYDTYTSTLLQRLVRWLARLHCTVIVLTATLPNSKRRELLDAYVGGPDRTAIAPYPSVTVCGPGGGRSVHFEVPSRQVGLSTVGYDPREIADRLADALADGGCAAVVCNTVARSQEVYRAVRGRMADIDCELHLLHSRFPSGRRREIEETVVSRFGKAAWKGVRPHRAIVVATQIIEQSLDLDFDLLVSDLAPVDLMLQRVGRLHRHSGIISEASLRPRQLATPTLWIAQPELDDAGVPSFGVDVWVYDLLLLLRTYRVLLGAGRAKLNVPGDVEGLIEAVYGPEQAQVPSDEWTDALQQAEAAFNNSLGKDGFEAAARAITSPDNPDGVLSDFNQDLPDDDRLQSALVGGLTRKMRQTVRLICLHRSGKGVYLDAGHTRGVGLDKCPTGEDIRALLDCSVALAGYRVVEFYRDQRVPEAWKKVALLRNAYPLVFDAGRAPVTDALEIELDETLGIVVHYARREGAGE